ncbi:MAG: UDP-N-acetylmuramoyl-L-alanine--D-glutamate ligase [Patescibacteria group bacterium]
MNKNSTNFEFVSYEFEPEQKRIFFNYKQEFKDKNPILFTETIILPQIPDLNGIPPNLLNKILEGLHLILGISYYKFYCATKIKIRYTLSKKEADFWNTIYRQGLGEFYFRNKINPNKSPKFSFDKKTKYQIFSLPKNNKCLVALSGGKDSIVAAELLKEQGIDVTAFFVETQKDTDLPDNIAKKMGVNLFKIKRFLDSKIFDKHDYDGHIPISAIYGFLGILYAALYKYSYFVVANEYSSNFGNIKYKGEIVNHQWSKSSEFESLFSDYVYNFITPDVKYFSLLRPFYEIRIAEMFLKYKKYFSYFSSCNKNFKVEEVKKTEGLWCGECPKCVFAFTLLSAFLQKEELLSVFKKNLYQDKNLLSLFKDILGLGKMKPFDCVGTFEESKATFKLGSKKFKTDLIVKELLHKIKIKESEIKKLYATRKSLNIPSQFRFSGMKNVLILGYGKEGKISKKYLENNFPNLKIGIADEKLGKKYLEKQKKFDIAIKTPGIKKNLVKIPYTTATNIFFSRIKNKTIGVTGSKGKSTTASLIYAILKEAGKNVKLLGNIGNPMLEIFLQPINEDEIFVLELSSYQLDDIDFSPNIAVLTNLFPEHMDYHSGIENYYEAKKNIINFQNKKDLFIYNQKNKELKKWASSCMAKAVPYTSEILLDKSDIPLLGEHNIENMRAAITVAKEFNVSDETIKKAIKNFKSLPHRLEFIGEFKGIKFYDDAISTTPESTIMAIKSLKNIDTIFLGGEDRGYDFLHLEKTIKKYKINNIVLFPESGKRMKLKSLNILRVKSMEEAVKFAYKHTKEGRVCLLSCASPSYSLWKNFEEKGNQFQSAVKKYAKKPF